jgi:hypothetical protein
VRRARAATAVVALALGPAPAFAQSDQATDGADAADLADPVDPGHPADPRHPADPVDPSTVAAHAARQRDFSLELGAHVFVRDTMSRVDVGGAIWRHERDIDQARLSAVYDRKRLRLAIEVDFAGGDADLKDTYIRVKPVDMLRIQAGHFKVPMSFLGLESKWRLPSIERGLLSELDLEDRDLPFTGERADGLSLQLRPDLPLAPRATAALFQSPLSSGLAPIDAGEDVTQDAYARVEIEPVGDIHAAAGFGLVGYQARLGQADSLRHLAFGSLEIFADTRHLRAWIECFAGQSFFYQPSGTFSGSFAAARALVSPRIRDVLGIHRLEPYAGASFLEPTDDRDGDQVSELVAGVNVAVTRHWRLQVEGAQRIAQGGASPVADTTLIRIQLGAAFAEKLQ